MTLYATDLDGTLLRPDMTISDETAGIINEMVSRRVLFTYATARSYSSASPLLTKLHLNCPAVTFNGVFVIDPKDGRHIVENVFSPAAVEIAVSYFNRMGRLLRWSTHISTAGSASATSKAASTTFTAMSAPAAPTSGCAL